MVLFRVDLSRGHSVMNHLPRPTLAQREQARAFDPYAGGFTAQCFSNRPDGRCYFYGGTGHTTTQSVPSGSSIVVLPNAAARIPGFTYARSYTPGVHGYLPTAWIRPSAGYQLTRHRVAGVPPYGVGLVGPIYPRDSVLNDNTIIGAADMYKGQQFAPPPPAYMARPGNPASVLVPHNYAASVSRQAYQQAEAKTKALLAEWEAFGRSYKTGDVDTNKGRQLAARLRAAGLHAQSAQLLIWMKQVDDARARAPAPGGAPLSPPTYTSPFAVTRGAKLPGISFIVKPAHFRDMDGEKSLQEFIGKMIPVINSALGLGMIPYADSTLHAGEAWKPVWSSFGRDPHWGTYSGNQIAKAIYYEHVAGKEFGAYPTFIDLGTKHDTWALASTE